MVIKKYKEIRKRGHFTIIDDHSVQRELSRMLLEKCRKQGKDAVGGKS